ncbi:MAG: hypothetical protein ACR2GY_05415 [Phycisphaerales bacterium]
MTASEWAYLIGGLVVAFLATRIAQLAGKFWMRLNGLNEAIYCSIAFLKPATRWLTFYFPILLLSAIAAWMVPHWGWAIFIFGWVAWSFKAGIRNAYLDALRRQTEYHLEDGKQLDEAHSLARRDVDATVSMARMR